MRPDGGLGAILGRIQSGTALDVRARLSLLRQAATLQQVARVPFPDRISIDGVSRPTQNSRGQPIAASEAALAAFWRWFGDSRVVDDQGRPLVVYHGTYADFAAFDRRAVKGKADGMDSIGSWFTDNPARASDYGSTVMAVYLSIKRPMVVGSFGELADYWSDSQPRRGAAAKAHKNNRHYGDSDAFRDEWGGAHDGIHIQKNGAGEWVDQNAFVAFEPQQIKSAVGNGGTFNPQSGNILDSALSPVAARMATLRELGGLLDDLSGGGMAPMPKMAALRRVMALVEALGGRGATTPQGKAIAFDLANAAASEQALLGYLQGGLDHLPEALRPFEVLAIQQLARATGRRHMVDATATVYHKNTGTAPASDDVAKRAVFDAMVARGVQVDVDAEAIKSAMEQRKEILQKTYSDFPEYKQLEDEHTALHQKYLAIVNAIYEAMDVEKQSLAAGNGSRDRVNDMRADAQQQLNEYNAQSKIIRNKMKKLTPKIDTRRTQAVMKLFRDTGGKIIQAVMERSTVTHERAMAWATQQTIDGNVLKKLRGEGYSKDQIIADMAEFYRLCNGKTQKIRLSLLGAKRSFAQGLGEATGEKVIAVGSSFDKRTLFHEMAHFIEDDPIARGAANGYLIKRRKSDKAVSLRALTGRKYQKHEIAYEDDFLDPYMGKVYNGGVTEVFSMGVEYLSDPARASILVSQDPELFALVTGYLTSEATPAVQAKLQAHSASSDARASREELFEQAIERLAGRIDLKQDGWWQDVMDSPNEKWREHDLVSREAKRGSTVEYLGSFNGIFMVFSGVFRVSPANRFVKSWLIAAVNADRVSRAAVSESLDLAKAMIAIHVHDGIDYGNILRTVYRYAPAHNKTAKDQKFVDEFITAAGLEPPAL